MRALYLFLCIFSLALFADPYPLYVRYIPYTPPNLHLSQQRATTAYYLPSLNQGVTYHFDYAVAAPTDFASGSVPMRMAIYRSPSGCAGIKTIRVDLSVRIGGVFQTLSTTTQTIFVPFWGGIVPVFDINGLTTPEFSVQNGDIIRLDITPTAGGSLCLVNEYPTGGTDSDATHIVLQTAPKLSLNKISKVISDPINGTTNPKRIPGATVRYRLIVTNDSAASGSGENIVINDTIPANTAYVANTITYDGAPQTDANDADNASFNAGTVQVNIGTMAPGDSHTITFDVTIP